MKILVKSRYSLASLLLLMSVGCKKDAGPNQSCAGEHLLEAYQDREAVVVISQGTTYCLVVDSSDIAHQNYGLENYLVPVPAAALPTQYRVAGLRVLLNGRKKSCYGLTTSSQLRTSFGYKLEIDAVRKDPAH